MRAFAQVDVFSARPMFGNPVAVVVEAEGMSDADMAAFARWTNLSETTFLLPPRDASADYRVRIFTPGRELPFAGHPTLGSAHAWLEANPSGVARETITQECGVGLVSLRRREDRLAFAAPPLVRDEPLDGGTLDAILAACGLGPDDVVAHRMLANGPEWACVLMSDPERVLAVTPDMAKAGPIEFALVAPWGPSGPADFEVRGFAPGVGLGEDPVTGSLNAGLGEWLTREGFAPNQYIARQGTALGRNGRIHIAREGDTIWVAGHTTTVLRGAAAL